MSKYLFTQEFLPMPSGNKNTWGSLVCYEVYQAYLLNWYGRTIINWQRPKNRIRSTEITGNLNQWPYWNSRIWHTPLAQESKKTLIPNPTKTIFNVTEALRRPQRWKMFLVGIKRDTNSSSTSTAHLVNMSINQSLLPNAWKSAVVFIILKPVNLTYVVNCGPISYQWSPRLLRKWLLNNKLCF